MTSGKKHAQYHLHTRQCRCLTLRTLLKDKETGRRIQDRARNHALQPEGVPWHTPDQVLPYRARTQTMRRFDTRANSRIRPWNTLYFKIFHHFMRPDQRCVSFSSLSIPLGEVFPSLGLPQLNFSVPSRLYLDLDVRQTERTDKVRSSVSLRHVLGGCPGQATHGGRRATNV
jgi:hypothetical protein